MRDFPLTRRDALRRGAGLGAAALLAAGAWPGWAGAADAPAAEDFAFVCVNDLHFFDKKCIPFFEQMARQMRAGAPASTQAGRADAGKPDAGAFKPDFCLVVGDLVEDATPAQFGLIRDLLRTLGMPVYVVPGNHDHLPDGDRRTYEQLFPNSVNYRFDHKGWQFVALDTTQGRAATGTAVQKPTLDWLAANAPKLEKKRPTVLFTHFPMGAWVPARPGNADAVLTPFQEVNLQAVFNGHYHAQTERRRWSAVLTTDKCCSFHHANHDRSPEKGYFACTAKDGRIARTFVEVKLA